MTNDNDRWAWRKSSYSGQGNCVEVAANRPDVVAVRDSKDPGGAVLTLSRDEWRAFLRALETAGALPQ